MAGFVGHRIIKQAGLSCLAIMLTLTVSAERPKEIETLMGDLLKRLSVTLTNLSGVCSCGTGYFVCTYTGYEDQTNTVGGSLRYFGNRREVVASPSFYTDVSASSFDEWYYSIGSRVSGSLQGIGWFSGNILAVGNPMNIDGIRHVMVAVQDDRVFISSPGRSPEYRLFKTPANITGGGWWQANAPARTDFTTAETNQLEFYFTQTNKVEFYDVTGKFVREVAVNPAYGDATDASIDASGLLWVSQTRYTNGGNWLVPYQTNSASVAILRESGTVVWTGQRLESSTNLVHWSVIQTSGEEILPAYYYTFSPALNTPFRAFRSVAAHYE